MDNWIKVEDRLPACTEKTLYLVVLRVGSMRPKTVVSTMLFIVGERRRFIVGDWQKVTHWQEMPELPEGVE